MPSAVASSGLMSSTTIRRVAPGNLAATVFHHLGIPQDSNWIDPQGCPRWIDPQGCPRSIVADAGKVIAELVG
jgi:hypothetical protein